jgi:hypothetical protein
MAGIEDLEPDRVAAVVSRSVVDAVAAGGDVESVVARALAGARAALGLDTSPTAQDVTRSPSREPRAVVTEHDVIDVARAGGSELRVPAGGLVTPLARDTARDRGVSLVEA